MQTNIEVQTEVSQAIRFSAVVSCLLQKQMGTNTIKRIQRKITSKTRVIITKQIRIWCIIYRQDFLVTGNKKKKRSESEDSKNQRLITVIKDIGFYSMFDWPQLWEQRDRFLHWVDLDMNI